MKEKVSMNIAKATGIILIVAGHSFTEESQSVIRSFVYLFHVPMFFIISGYFYKDEYSLHPIVLIRKRLKSLWVPFLLWSVPFILLHNAFGSVNIYGDIMFRGNIIKYADYEPSLILKKLIFLFAFKNSEQLLGAFWFLPCLFFTNLIFMLFSMISEKTGRKILLPVLCISGFLTGSILKYMNIGLPVPYHDLRLYLITVFIFYIGYLYRKYESRIKMDGRIAAASFLLLILIDIFPGYKIVSIDSVTGHPAASLLYLIATPLLGTYLVLWISGKAEKMWIRVFFNSLGKSTITILALHFLCFKVVNLIIAVGNEMAPETISSFPVMADTEKWFPAYLAAGVLIPYALHKSFSSVIITVKNRKNP